MRSWIRSRPPFAFRSIYMESLKGAVLGGDPFKKSFRVYGVKLFCVLVII
jgi:hypothetical protein